MSLNEFTKPTPDNDTQPSLFVASNLIDSSTLMPDDNPASNIPSESDELPEKFSSAPLPKAVIRPDETDRAFVREQPW